MKLALALLLCFGCATVDPRLSELSALKATVTAADQHVGMKTSTIMIVTLDMAKQADASLESYDRAVSEYAKALTAFSGLVRNARAAIEAAEAQIAAGVIGAETDVVSGSRDLVRGVVKVAQTMGAQLASP
jgi:hypothetical protein